MITNRTIGAVARAASLLTLVTNVAGAQPLRARVGLIAFEEALALDTLAIGYAVTAPPRTVMFALDDAFKAFDIPVTVRDSFDMVIGNVAYKRMHTFANAPASKSLNCGGDITGWNADEMRLTIAILALVDPGKDGGTRIRIGMAASAEDVIGQKRPPIRCVSSGRLEAAMAEFVKKRTGG